MGPLGRLSPNFYLVGAQVPLLHMFSGLHEELSCSQQAQSEVTDLPAFPNFPWPAVARGSGKWIVFIFEASAYTEPGGTVRWRGGG